MCFLCNINVIINVRSTNTTNFIITIIDKILLELADLNVKSKVFFDRTLSSSHPFVPLVNGANAERPASTPLNNSPNDVQENDRSVRGSNAERVASIPATSEDTFSSQNTTELLTNSLLLNELNGNDDDNVPNDDSMSSSRKLQRHFHLSRASIDTTTTMIYDHMRKNGVLDASRIKVTKLVPRNRDISTLSFISFKIDTNDDIAAIINTPNFWPNHCVWKNFIPKSRPVASFSATNPFLGDHRSTPHKST